VLRPPDRVCLEWVVAGRRGRGLERAPHLREFGGGVKLALGLAVGGGVNVVMRGRAAGRLGVVWRAGRAGASILRAGVG